MRLALAIFLLPLLSFAADIIPDERRTDWTLAGVPSGVIAGFTASRTNIVNVQDFGAVGNGVTDDWIAFTAAFDSLTGEEVLYIPPGRYLLTNRLYYPYLSSVTIRGSGTNSVLLFNECDGFWFGSSASPTTKSLLAEDGVRGATNIVLTNATGFTVGKIMVVDQLNDTNFVDDLDSGCTWCSVVGDVNRVFHQRVMITAVDGNTVTFWPPLAWTFQTNLVSMAYERDETFKHVGIENLKLVKNYTGYVNQWNLLQLNQYFQSWVHNVEFDGLDGRGIYAYNCLQCEVKGCYFNGVETAATPDRGYGVEFLRGSFIKIEDCAFRLCQAPIQLPATDVSVVAYNFFTNTYIYNDATWITGSANAGHGAHSRFCLVEGNTAVAWRGDTLFGSVSHHTVFRNNLTGWEANKTNYAKVIDLQAWCYSNNIVGNVLGKARVDYWNGWQQYTNGVQQDGLDYPNSMIIRYGFFYPGNYATNNWDFKTWPSTLLHGNWDGFGQAVRWDGAITNRTFPDSLYLASKPTWYSNATWPPVVSTVPSAAQIPAQMRFLGLDYSTNKNAVVRTQILRVGTLRGR